ncbi:GNAT family N-acetyltransferase [Methylocaldum sp. 14B]|jgi:RimJ/RimL family protein N-acetyltransferase|uniref:GNAT family N-acetyltransferase n=1 Tax=unclassified Methylocaldum TaxID=2622260 RepID=UPI00197B6015|nr:GNAT family N-acetyltransferase [Methylocaldum sp. 14B]
MTPPLLGSGLCIRPFREDDGPAFVDAAHESVHSVGRWMPRCHQGFDLDAARSWFGECAGNIRSGSAYDLGVFSTEDGEFYGGIAINQINREHGFGNIGYSIRQSRQGQGIATRAVRLIAGFGFSEIRLTRLEIVAIEGNYPNRRGAEKSGATFECIARNRLMLHGRPRRGLFADSRAG